MAPVLLLDLVGLTPRMIGPDTPNLAACAEQGGLAPMTTVLPAVTCSAQATMLTGLRPDEHGAVGNGWLDPATTEHAFWRQSNHLVGGEKLYEAARATDASFTCAKLFWWWNMGARVDWSITPRPFYPADGRKLLAVYSSPSEFGTEVEGELGAFPFFDFWGPKAGLASSRWITEATLYTLERHSPSLTLAYLPHLDYDLQRHGPDHPRSRESVRELDSLFGKLWTAARERGVDVVGVSEYGITAVDRPVHINRALRRAGLLAVRETPVGEVLDPFASRAFALADHQLAHVYLSEPSDAEAAVEVLESLAGVESLWVGDQRAEIGLDHPRAGDLVATSDARSWFTYYYWLDDANAPDFAPTVDIHRKPGYDPCELFVDPRLAFPKLRIARRLLQKVIGMRMLIDVIPIDANLVGGSHGRLPDDPADGPLFLCSRPIEECGPAPGAGGVAMSSVKNRVLQLLE
ncbi:MAG: alkaline phosphatase family protein [Planctomycetota bacterium]|jgi:predicted AlkP superfamily pyrophosphatase or phosphodiesterase|nr:alkaline phosphatase family protein [Planctomycetota bacterium]